MSRKERDRIKVLEQVKGGLIDQIQAGEILGICARQVRRVMKRYEASGDAGLVHKGRNKVSNRKTPAETKAAAVELLAGVYEGFGPTLAAEKLEERDGIKVSRETVRGWIAELGLSGPGRKKHPHRRRRPRRECFGEMAQMDTSEHDWLEGRGPRMSLVTIIDDATSRKLGRFFASDTGEANREMIKAWIEAHGRPVAFYTDRAGHFRQGEVVGGIIRELEAEHAKRRGRKRERLGEEIQYLRNGQDRMDYPRYARDGWPVGSGAAESTCKNLIKKRFGIPGAHWRRANIPKVLALRLDLLNGDDFAKDDPHDPNLLAA